MVPYATRFAEIYDEEWSRFALKTAPKILDLYRREPGAPAEPAVLDLCCGTGRMARYFLDHGCRVTGVDRAQAMLDRAVLHCAPHIDAGRAAFHRADVAGFRVPAPVDLCVSAYDALNHLPDMAALLRCLDHAAHAVRRGGMFVFDLKTRRGLAGWNSMSVTERPGWTLVTRGVYDGGDTAYRRLTGFIRDEDGRFTGFEESMTEHYFDPDAVAGHLRSNGWPDVYFALSGDLGRPAADIADASRIFVIARRGS
ncbi:class I SAM-dependent methyltransferase [Streptomyces sp. MP131-18]|uniref:class I SAM-dependent DNA methyltransferase n=1 Tax=Streptomyces sp. MP131-18 TaxID=1857892 RepID=UPI00097BF8A5|nr:class I SAM-dependent methyltransferase [Streptomyces sp. MP131-18]ONK15814.1 magnesium protoporphyrin O-methyltransferase [Streptomyces sp. MP131-18]